MLPEHKAALDEILGTVPQDTIDVLARSRTRGFDFDQRLLEGQLTGGVTLVKLLLAYTRRELPDVWNEELALKQLRDSFEVGVPRARRNALHAAKDGDIQLHDDYVAMAKEYENSFRRLGGVFPHEQ